MGTSLWWVERQKYPRFLKNTSWGKAPWRVLFCLTLDQLAHDILPPMGIHAGILTLLREKGEALLSSLPYKISISLHAPEANAAFADEGYFDSCIRFAKTAAAQGCIVALRLWNLGSGADNSPILDALHSAFPGEWGKVRGGSSLRLSDKLFLEWGERFDWPDPALPECDAEADLFCYGLRDHIGILVDGTVVPCCLDADANLALGNLFESELDDILASPRAKAIYDGFTHRRAVESLCRKCGYARRFSRS